MSTTGATSLNRILRVTANLLFQQGEDVPSVAKFLSGFVAPAMVRSWYERYCEVNGLDQPVNSKRRLRRMPMPPIDFEAVAVTDLERLLEPAPKASPPAPEW